MGDELDSRLRVADRIDRPHDFLRVPRVADLAFRVASLEQPRPASSSTRRRDAHGRWSSTCEIDRADLYCGRSGHTSRSIPAVGPGRAGSSRASRHGRDRRSGPHAGASCRTPTDTNPTDPTSPNAGPGMTYPIRPNSTPKSNSRPHCSVKVSDPGL